MDKCKERSTSLLIIWCILLFRRGLEVTWVAGICKKQPFQKDSCYKCFPRAVFRGVTQWGEADHGRKICTMKLADATYQGLPPRL